MAKIGIGELVIANRTVDRAQELGRTYGGRGVSLDDLDAEVAAADVVICAASSSDHLITRAHVADRRNQLVVVDLSMPPVVEPFDLEHVTRIDLQGLERATAAHRARREAEIPAVETIIARELEWLRVWARQEMLRPFVSTLRQKADAIRRDELERARQELGSDDPQRVLERFAAASSIGCSPSRWISSRAAICHSMARRPTIYAACSRSTRRATLPSAVRRAKAGREAPADWHARLGAGVVAKPARGLAARADAARPADRAGGDHVAWRLRHRRAALARRRDRFFTATIERALLANEVDIAVHSYKDLPVESTPGLEVAAVPERGPVEDVLCARNGGTFEHAAAGCAHRYCSARRTAQVRMVRRDLDIVPLRGNVPTRVERIKNDLDAIVLARAGLVRFGPGSGGLPKSFRPSRCCRRRRRALLAIQCRAADRDLVFRLSALNHEPTRRAVDAERAMLHALGGGCSVPVGALAVVDREQLHLTGGAAALRRYRQRGRGTPGSDPFNVGKRVAEALLSAGADAILPEFEGSRTRFSPGSPEIVGLIQEEH